ncbi:DUF6893 family small protein [Streptomyces kronopolitis]
MLKLAMSGVLAAALAVVMRAVLPDIKRYMRMRAM